MSQADELLATLMASVIEHEHPVTDSNSHFVIDPNTHAISNGSEEENVLMQYDHMSETYTFEIPRFVEGHDMMLCNRVRIHYIVIDDEGYKSYSDVDDASPLKINKDNPETVITTWCISRNATSLVGTLNFLVQYMCVGSDGETIVYEWHTDIYTNVRIKPGMNNAEQAVSKYSDILESWYQKLFGAGDTVIGNIRSATEEQMSAIEAKGAETLATIPEDYTATYNMAEEALRTRANAIVVDAEGEHISVSNASDDPLQSLRVFGKTKQVTTTGKNLFDPSILVDSGWEESNGVYVGLSSKLENKITTYEFRENTQYTLSLKGRGTDLGDVAVFVYFYYTDGTYTTAIKVASSSAGASYSFTSSDTKTLDYIRFSYGYSQNAYLWDIQLEEGTTVTSYEPYTGGLPSPSPEYPQELESIERLEVMIRGKNAWDHSYDVVDMTNTEGWGNPVWLNDAVVTMLRPDTTYTLSFDVTCLSIPEYETVFSGHCGFVLYSSNPDAVPTVMARHEGDVFTVGEKRTISSTFTTPSNVSDPNMRYEVFRYTQRFLKSDGNAVFATVCFDNVQLEESTEATEFEEFTKQTFATQHTLPGVPVTSGGNYTDSNGRQWIADEIVYDYQNDCWKYVQNCFRMTFTDFSNAKVTTPSGGFTEGYLSCGVTTKPKSFALCDKFAFTVSGDMVRFAMANTTMYFTLEGELTAEEWITKMTELSPTVLVPRAEPIITELTTEEVLAFKTLHANKPNTVIQNGAGAYMVAEYSADTEIFMRENQPGPTDEQIAAAVDAWLTNYFANTEG